MALELRRRGAPLSDVQQKKIKNRCVASQVAVVACGLIILVLYILYVV